MHWVLIYFLAQANAGGVGQIRFKTSGDCNQFYRELDKSYRAKGVKVNGVCMKWPKGLTYTEKLHKHFNNH